jgi:GTP-binding protein HflX
VLHIADAASPEVEQQVTAVRGVLRDIGAAGVPEVLALNKIDLLSQADRTRVAHRFPTAVQISAITGEGLPVLLERVGSALPRFPVEVLALIPYGRDELVAMLHRETDVVSVESTEEGTLVRAKVGERQFAAVEPYVVERRRPAS